MLLGCGPRRSDAAALAMRAPKRRTRALVLISIPSPIAPPIRTLAVAATDHGLLAPERATGMGIREAPALLLGCALRRSEVAALTMEHVQQRDGRWVILDLVSKHKRVRTVSAAVDLRCRVWRHNRVEDGSDCSASSLSIPAVSGCCSLETCAPHRALRPRAGRRRSRP